LRPAPHSPLEDPCSPAQSAPEVAITEIGKISPALELERDPARELAKKASAAWHDPACGG